MEILQKTFALSGYTEKKVDFYYVGIKEMKISVQKGCERCVYSWMQYMKYET